MISRNRNSIGGWWGAALIALLGLIPPPYAAGQSQQNVSSARDHLQRGATFLDQHNIPKALEEFQAAVRLAPLDASAHDNLGIAMAASGRNEEAAKEFEEAVRLSEDFAQAHLHLALAYDQLERRPEAIVEYEATLRLEPDLIDARYALSADCWKVGDIDGAIQLLRRVIKQNPVFADEVHYNLGLELKQAGKVDEATQELKTAVSLRPNSLKYHVGLCQMLTENLELDGAMQCAHEAIALAPENPEPYYDLAEALRLKGDFEGALAQLRRVIELNPNFPRAHRQLGLVLRQQGSYQAAAQELQEAVRDDPADAEVRYYLGSVFLKLNDLDRAQENLAEAVRIDPYNSAAHITYAGVLNRVDKSEDAQQEIKKAQELDRLKANAGRSRILLGTAGAHLKKGEIDAALGVLRQAVDLSPEYTEAHFQLALAMQKKGSPPVAVEKALRRVIELNSKFPPAHLQLGLLLLKAGRTDEATKELREALTLAPSLVEAHRALGRVAMAVHDWPTVISEFGAVLVWKGNDLEAKKALLRAQGQRKLMKSRN
jgi:tetratricopeptide (TPR) repeat protein